MTQTVQTVVAREMEYPYSWAFVANHGIHSVAKSRKIARAMRRGEVIPRVLVCKNPDDSYSVLDGHHRIFAAQLAKMPIRAYFVRFAELCGLVQDAETCMDFDSVIELPDGRIYAGVRDRD